MSASAALALAFAPMLKQDLDAVAQAELSLYEFPWTRGNFSDALDAGNSAWIATEGGRLAGYAILMLVLDESHLLNVSVLEPFQRRGIGGAFLSHLFSVSSAAGAQRMFLEVRPSNLPAISLYQRFAFRQVGRRPGYYPARSGREDALIMVREL